ncbi:MAG: tetratricopeptide repeat protein, partial [Planctomycetes bacterium]|nr:tetratricopeptide repeat protein [Planctomycetota bacterium]
VIKAVFFLFFVFILIRIIKARQKVAAVAKTFGAVARKRGMQVRRRMKGLAPPRLSGDYKGYRFTADVATGSLDGRLRSHTSIKLEFRKSLSLGLQLEWKPHTQDIHVGDVAFDQQISVRGDDAQEIREFLTPTRRFHCLRFLSRRGYRVIHDGGIHVQLRGSLHTKEAVDAVLESMAALADQLVGDTPPPLSKAIEEQTRGELDQALESVRAIPEGAPEATPDRKVLEGEILYTGGRYEEAADAFASARDADPNDAEAAAWHDQAAARAAGEEPPPLSEELASPLPEPPPSTDDGAQFDDVCASLFAPNVRSLQVSQLFEQHFQDVTVEWAGKLERANRASFDLVFGNDPCTKAVVELGEYGDGLASRMIHAVVQFPEDMAESLGDLQGKPVRFSGRLVRCDPFMRNLFVADAKLFS